MKVSAFDFELPAGRIAQRPIVPRDVARLLVVRPDRLDDRHVRDLPALLRAGDRLVYNDTRVIKARLRGRRGDAAVEVTLHRRLDPATWRAFARPARKLRAGDFVVFAPGFTAEVRAKREGGEVTLTFDLIERILHDTLPPLAYQDGTWWGNQKQGTQVEVIAWMDAGWMVEVVDLNEKWVRFVRQ